MAKKILALFILLLPLLATSAQVNVDSLSLAANNTDLPDSSRLQAMYALANHYRFSQLDSTKLLAEQQLDLAETIGDTSAQALAYKMLGIYHSKTNDYDASLEAFQKGFDLSWILGDSAAAGVALSDIGYFVFEAQQDYEESTIDYYKEVWI